MMTVHGYRGRGLHGLAVEALGRRIAGGLVAPGSALPTEQEIADEFGVSRSVVREALKVLAAKGLVSARPMAGTRVRPRAEWHLLDPDVLSWLTQTDAAAGLHADLLGVRRIVEPAAARLAAERSGGRSLADLEGALAGMDASWAEPDRFLLADLAFHAAILTASGNELLEQLVGAIGTALRLGREIQPASDVGPAPLPADLLPAHARVVDAIRSGDGDAAEAAMRAVVEAAARVAIVPSS